MSQFEDVREILFTPSQMCCLFFPNKRKRVQLLFVPTANSMKNQKALDLQHVRNVTLFRHS